MDLGRCINKLDAAAACDAKCSVKRISLLITAIVCVSFPARAGANDLSLLPLVNKPAGGDPTADNAQFRSLVRELALVMTPTTMQPAETTGQSGFDFALDYNFHTLNFQQPYWTQTRKPGAAPLLMTLGARARKGFVLPVPLTSEIEAGAQWLIDSQLLNLGANVRVALNEGFRWIPDLAVSAGINRMVGSDEIDLLTVTAGAQISKGFGVFGSFNLCPFAGYQSIWVNGASRIIDADPTNTANVDDNVLFQTVSITSAASRSDRFSGGVRLIFAVVQLTAGLDVNVLDGKPLLQYGLRAGVTL